MKLSDLKVNPSNPRTIKDARFKKLCDSIRDFPKMMTIRPMVYDGQNGNVLLGGNMRYLACKKLGMTEIPNEWVRDASELTEDEKKRFIVADNQEFGSWDYDLLANSFDTADLVEWGMEERELGVSGDEDGVGSGDGETEAEKPTIILCPKCGHEFSVLKKGDK